MKKYLFPQIKMAKEKCVKLINKIKNTVPIKRSGRIFKNLIFQKTTI